MGMSEETFCRSADSAAAARPAPEGSDPPTSRDDLAAMLAATWFHPLREFPIAHRPTWNGADAKQNPLLHMLVYVDRSRSRHAKRYRYAKTFLFPHRIRPASTNARMVAISCGDACALSRSVSCKTTS